jgi:hypothetical protein
MNKLTILGIALLGASAYIGLSCSSDDNKAATTNAGGQGTGASGGTNASGGSGQAGSAQAGTGNAGSSNAGASNAGNNAGGAACGTTNGTHTENTTFGTAGSTAPYALNQWGWGTATIPTVTQTTTGPTGIDCSTGCAVLTTNFAAGTAAYSAGLIVDYFGTTDTSVENLLNETITIKLAVSVTAASGATAAPPVGVELFGFDTTTGVNTNIWLSSLGTLTELDAASGFHTKTYKVVDAQVPSWAPTRTVCADSLHSIGIRLQNSAAIDATNAATIAVYVQSVSVAP